MQMKKTLGILLAVCFLMSVTAAAVSAEKYSPKEKNDKKVETKVVKILKVIKKHNGIMKLQLIKNTLKVHGHVKKIWFTTEWKFEPFHKPHFEPKPHRN